MEFSARQMDRLSLYVLGIVGVIIVVGGYMQIRGFVTSYDRNVLRPAQLEVQKRILEAQTEASTLTNSSEAATIAELKTKDSDNDTLNDFDEEYVYGTSRYLADSDSDGKKDQEEVQAGGNPNCPEGAECLATSSTTSNVNAQISSAALDAFGDLRNTNSAGATSDAQLQQLAANPTELRSFLKQKGVTDDVLNKTDDATLLALAKDAMQVSSAQDVSTNPEAAATAQASAIKASSIEQKKAILKQSGVSDAEIAKYSDEQINALIGTAVDQALTSLGKANPQATNQTGNTNQ
jgi:hypothetical protein